MTANRTSVIAICCVLLMLVYTSLFTINEGQGGLLLRLGKIVVNSKMQAAEILQPGLHAKIPILNQVYKFDLRLQTLDIQSSRIVTAEKKDVIVDYYVKWRIKDPSLYLTRTGGNKQQAEILLGQQINDSLRAEFGRRTIKDVISDDRINIMDNLNKQANLNAQRLGIDVVDVRIKRIDLPSEVSAAVYERMRAERERIAAEHRAQGRAKAEGIRASADANAAITIAVARANAARFRAEGDSEAAKIYADAYNKDPGFYAFYRSITAYKQIFGKDDLLVLKPDNQFFKYFQGTHDNSGQKK